MSSHEQPVVPESSTEYEIGAPPSTEADAGTTDPAGNVRAVTGVHVSDWAPFDTVKSTTIESST